MVAGRDVGFLDLHACWPQVAGHSPGDVDRDQLEVFELESLQVDLRAFPGREVYDKPYRGALYSALGDGSAISMWGPVAYLVSMTAKDAGIS